MRHFDLFDSRLQLILIGLLLAIVLGGVGDLILDRPPSLWSFHVLFEVGFVLLCFGTAAFLWVNGYQSERSLRRTHEALAQHRAELDEWRERTRRLIQGLAEEIDGQLQRWGLSPAEREAALFLLKGYSTKEIAHHLGKSERTVRQHCGAVYKKSGLAGRAELSAFFLEDLLLPIERDTKVNG